VLDDIKVGALGEEMKIATPIRGRKWDRVPDLDLDLPLRLSGL